MIGVRRTVVAVGVLSLVLGSAAAAGGAPASPGSPKYAQSTADYVASAVRDAFDRPATDADLARWAPALDVGGSRTTFALDLVREREWSERVVRDLYEFVLRRTPDPGGLAFWTEKLRSGFRSANLAAALYASNEFYEGAGAKPSAYVSLVYVSILDRVADDAGKAYWVRKLESGQPRSVIARAFWLTHESNARRADQLHVRFLRRSATATEREIWAQRFTTEDDKLLAAALIASDEYYLWSQGRESINPPVTIGAATGS